MQSNDKFQSDISKLREEVEDYAKQFPTIGFEKETMKYKDWDIDYEWSLRILVGSTFSSLW